MTKRQKNTLISAGVVAATLLAFLPGFAVHSTFIALMTNLFWIWE